MPLHESTTPLSWMGGLLLASALILVNERVYYWGLSFRDWGRLPASKERESILPFHIMYMTSGSLLLTSVAAMVGNLLLALVRCNAKFRTRLENLEKSWASSMTWVKTAGRALIIGGILVFLQNCWDLKILRCLDSVEEREPDNWWRYRVQVQINRSFNRVWWRAMTEVYIELVNASVYMTGLCIGFFAVKQILLPSLIWIERGVGHLLARIWRRRINHHHPSASASPPFSEALGRGPTHPSDPVASIIQATNSLRLSVREYYAKREMESQGKSEIVMELQKEDEVDKTSDSDSKVGVGTNGDKKKASLSGISKVSGSRSGNRTRFSSRNRDRKTTQGDVDFDVGDGGEGEEVGSRKGQSQQAEYSSEEVFKLTENNAFEIVKAKKNLLNF